MFKKALVSSGISVLIGVLVMTVSVAFGAQVPTGAPPGDPVHPTFSGLTVEGDVEIPDGTLHVSEITNPIGHNNLEFTTPVNFADVIITDSVSLPDPFEAWNIYVKTAISNPLSSPQVPNEPVVIDDGVVVEGNIDAGGIDASGDLFVKGTSTFEGGFDGSLQGGSGSMISTNNANVSGLLYVNDIDVGGDLTVATGNLSVGGHLQVSSVGAFNTESSSYVSVSPGSYKTVSESCSAGTTIVSCGFSSTSSYLNVSQSYISGNTCYVRARNTMSSSYSVKAVSRCWDPDK